MLARRSVDVGMFGEDQASLLGVVIEDFGIASPVQGGFKLTFDFVLAEMLVQDVVEELFRNRVVRLGMKNVVDLLQDRRCV